MMKMYTQIILLLFGIAAVAGHALKEPDVNPCLEEYKEPTRKFTNGHGFQYLYRRRPLEIVQRTPAKMQDAADVTVPTPVTTQSTTKVTIPTTAAEENTPKVTVPTTAAEESTPKVTVSSTTEDIRDLSNVTVPAVSTRRPNTDKVTATKNRRNNMFNAMRERYHSSKNKNSNSSDNSRQKRQINSKAIPEAPTLPKLDVQSFPEYVQKMLASRPTFEIKNKTVNREQNSDSLRDHLEKVFSDDTDIYENPRTYGMRLNNGQGYSWNLINGKNKNTYNDNQHVSEPVQESIESQQANITHEKTEQKNISNIDKESNPTATIKEEISNTLKDNDLQDKPIVIVEEAKENDKPNNSSNDNIKDKLNEIFSNINGTPKNSKLRTYGMSLKDGTANIWNELAGAPNFKIETTAATPVIDVNTKNITSKIKNDTMEPTNDESIVQNNIKLVEGSSLNKDENNNKPPTLDENQMLHLTTLKPKISFKTTPEPNQKIKRLTEENTVNPKQSDLRDKMEKSFEQILAKFPPFETITSKPNATTEVEKIDKVPKTYGMNLTGSHGYVWNELTNPGVRYNVGEKETSNSTDQINTELPTSPLTEESENENSSQPSTEITGTESPTTSEVTSFSQLTTEFTSEFTTTESNSQTTEITSQSTTTESNPETTKITSECTTTESKPQTTEISSESTTTESNPDTTKITSEFTTTESKPQTTEISCESTTIESNHQTTEEQPQTTEKSQTTETSSATADLNDKDDKKENMNQEEGNKDNNPVQISLDELLKKDEFWDWLLKWTTLYIEVFNEHIEKTVKDEVAKQLKDYMNNSTENKKDCVNNEENKKDDMENDKKPTEIDIGVLDNKVNNTDQETNKTKEKDEDDNKSNAEDKGNSKTNVEKEANKLNQKINQSPLNVKAKSIYGGAVGNEHVTNIFIFDSNSQANKTIQSLLDRILHKNPVTTSLDDDKNKDSDESTTTSTLSEEKDKPDNNETSDDVTSNETEPSSITSTTMADLEDEDKKDNENSNEITTDSLATESSSIDSEDTSDSKTESTMTEEQSIETSEDDTITVAITSNSTTAATTLAIDDDISSTSGSTEASSVNCCNSTDDTTTLTSNVKEVHTDEYDCATKDPTELVELEVSIGAKNADNNKVKKCIRKEKEKERKKSGVLATLGISLKNPLKSLLNI